jgi:hypothetical protein
MNVVGRGKGFLNEKRGCCRVLCFPKDESVGFIEFDRRLRKRTFKMNLEIFEASPHLLFSNSWSLKLGVRF